MYAQIMVKVGHLRPAVMAMVLRLEGSQADILRRDLPIGRIMLAP